MQRPRPLRTDRIRTVERPFGWIPFRILTSGRLAELSLEAKLLYFFLCLVADAQGMSYYGERRLTALLDLSAPALARARSELVKRDLVAFDGRLYQLLSLPRETPCAAGVARRPPSAVRAPRGAAPQQLRELLATLGGRRP